MRGLWATLSSHFCQIQNGGETNSAYMLLRMANGGSLVAWDGGKLVAAQKHGTEGF